MKLNNLLNIKKINENIDLYEVNAKIFDGCKIIFTGRKGGVSNGVCSSLNISFSSGDIEKNVVENRRRILYTLKLNPRKVIFQEQVHKDSIRIVEDKWLEGSALDRNFYMHGIDAMITSKQGIALVARGADCPMISLFDPKLPQIAVIHAGWKSTVNGITAKVIKKMVEKGSEASNIKAFVGPSAGPCCYEVGAEFRNIVRESDWVKSEHLIKRNIENDSKNQHSFYFDLWKANEWQMKQSKMKVQNILNPEICTICNNDNFFSYRCLGKGTGSQALIVWLPDKL